MAMIDPTGIVVGFLDQGAAENWPLQPGFTLRPAGNASVGDVGVIPNTALRSPVLPAPIFDEAVGIPALSLAHSSALLIPLVVPQGVTTACFSLEAMVKQTNNTAVDDTLNVEFRVGSEMRTQPTAVPAGAIGIANLSLSRSLLNLTGGDAINLEAQMYSATGAWAWSSFNSCSIQGYVLWFR